MQLNKVFLAGIAALAALCVFADGALADTVSDEDRFVAAINAERTAAGLPGLAVDGQLINVARAQSGRMAAAGTIFHNQNLAHDVVGNWIMLGENVGMGGTVDALHQAFMNSPHHRENVLGDYDHVGIGIVMGGSDGATIFVTELFWKTARARVPVSVRAHRARRTRARFRVHRHRRARLRARR
jgi:uncharacterized protein YkwD